MGIRTDLEKVSRDIWSDGILTIRPVETEEDIVCAVDGLRLREGQEELVNPAWFSIGRAYLSREDNLPCLVTERDGTAVGFINIGRWLGSGDACTWSFFIDGDHQGKGYGRRTAKLAVDILRATGCRQIKLAAETANKAAQRLYMSLGFRRLEEMDGEDLVYGLSCGMPENGKGTV